MKDVLGKIQVQVNVKEKIQYLRKIRDSDKNKSLLFIVELRNLLKKQVRKTKIYINKEYTKAIIDQRREIKLKFIKNNKQTQENLRGKLVYNKLKIL